MEMNGLFTQGNVASSLPLSIAMEKGAHSRIENCGSGSDPPTPGHPSAGRTAVRPYKALFSVTTTGPP